MKKQPTAEHVKTLLEVAEIVNVAEQTLHEWRRKGLVFPVKGRKGYSVAEWKRRLSEFAEAKKAAASSAEPTDPRTRKLLLECEKLIIGLKVEEEHLKQEVFETKKIHGEMISIHDHRATMDAIRDMVLTGLEQLAENVSTRARSVKVRDLLRIAVDDLRNRIANG